jgi:hypothetical protein
MNESFFQFDRFCSVRVKASLHGVLYGGKVKNVRRSCTLPTERQKFKKNCVFLPCIICCIEEQKDLKKPDVEV